MNALLVGYAGCSTGFQDLTPQRDALLGMGGEVSLAERGEYSTLEVGELFGVGRSTVYRAIERQRLDARAGLAETATRR